MDWFNHTCLGVNVDYEVANHRRITRSIAGGGGTQE